MLSQVSGCYSVFGDGMAARLGTECRTLGAHVLGPLDVIHFLERLGLFLGELLLIIVLAWSRYPVEEDAALLRVAEVVDNGGDDQTRLLRRPERRRFRS